MRRLLVLACLLSTGFVSAEPVPTGASSRRPFDDASYDATLDDAAFALAKHGAFFNARDLEKADAARIVAFSPIAPSTEKQSGGALYRRASRSTLMLVAVSKKDIESEAGEATGPAVSSKEKLVARKTAADKTRPGKIRRTSMGGATAFVVNSSGVIVTCRHALEFDGPFVLAAVTAEGRVIGVKEILLADRTADLAFLKIDATDLPALPLSADIEAGENIRVMAHPSGYYFHMTEGIVARHSRVDPDEKDEAAPRPQVLDITADIAEGSSGGPVLDDRGNVVGIAQAYALAENDDQQTAFKHRDAIPAVAVLSRMKPVPAPGATDAAP